MKLSLTPHDYQLAFHADVTAWLADPGDERRRLYASPTGTGKSVMAIMALESLPNWVLVTPRLEIVAGILAKLGVDTTGWNDDKLAEVALTYRITTPVRFRNMLAKGTFPFRPAGVILDEAHHDLANTYAELSAYLGSIFWIGLTATPFRGTPRGTAELLEKWGGVVNVLTIPQAVARGCLAVPTPKIWPLVDDDEVTVTNGEFVAASLDAKVTSSLDEVVKACGAFVNMKVAVDGSLGNGILGTSLGNFWNRPTLFACPTTPVCHELTKRLNAAGLPARVVVQDTPRSERNEIFAAAMKCEVAVVQIDVVSEGVDLPFRRLIDLRPTMSPVKWMQQVGRITRPINKLSYEQIAALTVPLASLAPEAAPEYYCCNRNLERHGYLFNGALPPQWIAEAQQAFTKPTKRTAARVFGLENIGRFQAAEVKLANGMIASLYNLVSTDAFSKVEYAALVHPGSTEILYARRESARDPKTGTFEWGKWVHVEGIPDVKGFGSAPAKTLTPNMEAKWARQAAYCGLDASTDNVTRRNFAVLPMLLDLRMKL